MKEATAALKLALEALVDVYDAVYVRSEQEAEAIDKCAVAITAIKKALAQDELCSSQEPVAWIDHDEISTSTHFLTKPKTYGCDPNEFTEPCKHFLTGITNKSATESPWVGLTDEEIREINAQVSQIPPINYTTTTYARALEAKLKEKNT